MTGHYFQAFRYNGQRSDSNMEQTGMRWDGFCWEPKLGRQVRQVSRWHSLCLHGNLGLDLCPRQLFLVRSVQASLDFFGQAASKTCIKVKGIY